MSVYFSICVSLSVGLLLGAVGGGVKKKLIKKDYTQKQIARNIKFISKAAGLQLSIYGQIAEYQNRK